MSILFMNALKQYSNILVSFVLLTSLSGCVSLFSSKESVGRELMKACGEQSQLKDPEKTKSTCKCIVAKHKVKLSVEEMRRLLQLYKDSHKRIPVTDNSDSQLWEYDVQTAEACL